MVWIILAIISLLFCAIIVFLLICFRACCSRKHKWYATPVDMPIVVKSVPPPSPVRVRPPPREVVHVVEETGDLWCAQCGLYHADMKHITMANLKDIDLEGLEEIKRRTAIADRKEYTGDATFERTGRRDASWVPDRPVSG